MIIIYDKLTTSFSSYGIGVLRDFIENPIITESLNEEYSLEFSYIKDGWLSDYLLVGNIIKANGQLFRIYNINRNLKETKVMAKHIVFDLNNNFLEDVVPTDKNAAGAIQLILDNAELTSSFNVWSDIETLNTARYVRKNIFEALITADNSIINKWGGEFEFDNFDIKLHSKRGEDRGLKIIYGKNLTGAELNIDFSTLVTRIMPQGNDELLLPERYIDSPNVSSYPTPIIRKMEFNIGVDDETTEEEAYELLRDEVQKLFNSGIDSPQISLKVDFIELSKVNEYEQYSNLETANLGDIVSVFIKPFGISYETRIVKTIYDCLKKRYLKLELGTVKPNYITSQNSSLTTLSDNLNKINPLTILSEAQITATNLINSAMTGYVIKTQSEILIMDTDNTSTATYIWRWNRNGLGFSSTGVNGTYNLAMTSDGKIVADFITVGSLDGSLIKAGSLLAESLSIEINKKFQSTGNNIFKGTQFNDLINWGIELGKNYIESPTIPDITEEGFFWYCTHDNGEYLNGKIYQYQSGNWELTSQTRKQLDESINLLTNFEIVDNDETKKMAKSERFGKLITNGDQIYTNQAIIVHKLEDIILDSDYMTFSFKIKNNIEFGEGGIGIDLANSDITSIDDVFSKIVFENIINIYKGSEDSLYEMRVPIIKQSNTIFGVSGNTPPTNTNLNWIYSETGVNGILMSYLNGEWVPDIRQLNFHDGTSYWCFINGVYFKSSITISESTKVSMFAGISPQFVTDMSETEPSIVDKKSLWGNTSTDELKIPIFINDILDHWEPINITLSQAVANDELYEYGYPFIFPKGTLEFYDCKLEYGDYSEWTAHKNEIYGRNFSITEKGLKIEKGNNVLFIDEDEIKATCKGITMFSIDEYEVFGQKMRTNEINVNGIIEKTIIYNGKKTAIKYMKR